MHYFTEKLEFVSVILFMTVGGRTWLGTQLRYEAPGDLRVEIVTTQWLTSGEWGCLLDNGPKLAVGQASNS